MFTMTALFTVIKSYPSVHGQVKDEQDVVGTMKYYSALKKEEELEVLLSGGAWSM
jgi:hypothetical protein